MRLNEISDNQGATKDRNVWVEGLVPVLEKPVAEGTRARNRAQGPQLMASRAGKCQYIAGCQNVDLKTLSVNNTA